MTTQSPSKTSSVDFNTPAMQRHRAMRHFKDHFPRWYVAVGGLGVIVAVLLIFLYLLYEVLPLFGLRSASVTAQAGCRPTIRR